MFVWGDGGAFNADAVFKDGIRCVNGDLIVGLVSVGEAQVVVLQVDVEVWVDEFVLDVLPYDARHFISVELDNGILDFDLLRGCG